MPVLRPHALRALSVLALVATAPFLGCGSGGAADPDNAVFTFENADVAATVGVAAAVGYRQTGGNPNALFTIGSQRFNVWTMVSDAVRSVGQPSGQDPCSSAGFVNRTVQDTDGNGVPSPNDSYSLAYTGCLEQAAGNRHDGTVLLTLTTYAGGGGALGFNLSGSVTVFIQIDTPNGLKTISGQFTVSASEDAFGTDVLTLDVITLDVQGPLNHSTWLSGHVQHTVQANGAYTLVCDGRVSSTRLGGTISWNTGPQGLTGQQGQWPSLGTLVIHGANLSTIRIAAIDALRCQVDLDADGDQVFESSNVRFWAALVH